jgi:histidyl-tRNA synthetase
VQLYGEQKKFKQKMSYCDKLGVPFAVLLGEDEIAAGKCSVKDMRTGQQVTVTAEEAAALIGEAVNADLPIILEK